MEVGHAKSFAFILYNFEDNHIKDLLDRKGSYVQLHDLSGKELTVFTVDSKIRPLLTHLIR